MGEPTTTNDRKQAWVSVWVTVILSAGLAVAIGVGVWRTLGREDTEAYESPLILCVARQLVRGPWGLYGPYGRQNLLVLIHAPVYYRLAALLAWPLTIAGFDVVSAARLAGRSLSVLGLAVTAWSAYRIARLDGAPARAGWWAACLIAIAPVVGVIPFTVRPDMLGIGLQTTGIMLVLTALQSRRPSRRAIAGAYAAFGVAMCVKQHLVGGPVVSTILLLWAWRRGLVSFGRIGLGLLIAVTIVAVIYVTEELVTGGHMSQAVFMAATETARVRPADWGRAVIVVFNIIGESSFLIVLMTAAVLAQVVQKPGGAVRAALAPIGTALIGLVVVLAFVAKFYVSIFSIAAALMTVSICLFLFIPACTILERRTLFADRLDVTLCLFGAAELIIVVLLCQASTGAWVNYGIQAIVFAAILTARTLSRACELARLRRIVLPIALVSLAALAAVLQDAYASLVRVRNERRLVTSVVQAIGRPSSELYFDGWPGRNRVYGNVEMVYDDWLYPVFESMHLAEPRSSWLVSALTRGSIRVVITSSDGLLIDGLDKPLPAIGYTPRFRYPPFIICERAGAAMPE